VLWLDAFKIDSPLGHYTVTKAALSDFYGALPSGRLKRRRIVPLFGIEWIEVERPTLLDILLDGVRDVDMYQFSPALPHAQTTMEKTAWHYSALELMVISQAAQVDFATMQSDRLLEIRSRLNRGDIRVAAYQLGMFLHSLQDLLTHQGITNPQHQVLDDQGQSPDAQPNVAVKAHGYTLRLLLSLPQIIGAEAERSLRTSLLSGQQVVRLTDREKRQIFGRGPDVFWSAPAYAYGPRDPRALESLESTTWPAEQMADEMTGPNAIKSSGRSNVGIERRICQSHRINLLEGLFYIPGQAFHLLIGNGY